MVEDEVPYAIKKTGNKYKVVNKATGVVHAKGTSEVKAKSQERLLQGIEHNPEFAAKIKAKVRSSR